MEQKGRGEGLFEDKNSSVQDACLWVPLLKISLLRVPWENGGPSQQPPPEQ